MTPEFDGKPTVSAPRQPRCFQVVGSYTELQATPVCNDRTLTPAGQRGKCWAEANIRALRLGNLLQVCAAHCFFLGGMLDELRILLSIDERAQRERNTGVIVLVRLSFAGLTVPIVFGVTEMYDLDRRLILLALGGVASPRLSNGQNWYFVMLYDQRTGARTQWF